MPRRVALTFDTEHPEGPCAPDSGGRILASLERAGAHATFFLQGRWVRWRPEEARSIVAAGHVVGNHSHHHAPFDGLTDDGIRSDVRQAEEAIRDVTGVDPRPLFRCPFGAGMEEPRVLGVLAELGYRHVGWDVDPRDWDVSRTANDVAEAVVEGVLARPGDATVLLHGWPDATAEALPRILDRLRTADAELVSCLRPG